MSDNRALPKTKTTKTQTIYNRKEKKNIESLDI